MSAQADTRDVSLAWEAASGYDSIATIERVYRQTPGGAYECCYPDCMFARRDAETLWRAAGGGYEGLQAIAEAALDG